MSSGQTFLLLRGLESKLATEGTSNGTDYPMYLNRRIRHRHYLAVSIIAGSFLWVSLSLEPYYLGSTLGPLDCRKLPCHTKKCCAQSRAKVVELPFATGFDRPVPVPKVAICWALKLAILRSSSGAWPSECTYDIYIYICIYAICKCVHIYMHINVYIYAYMCIYIYTHAYFGTRIAAHAPHWQVRSTYIYI